MYLQAQRLLGQQSLAEFMGLHLDLERIGRDNQAKVDVVRKNGVIINTGDNPSKLEVYKKREAHKYKYGLGQQAVANLQLPKVQTREWLKVLTLE